MSNDAYQCKLVAGFLTSFQHAAYDTYLLRWVEGQMVNYDEGQWSKKENIDQLLRCSIRELYQGNIRTIYKNSLISTDQQGINYYHFLIDIFPKIITLLSQAKAKNFLYEKIVLSDAPSFAVQLLALCGVPHQKIAAVRDKGVFEHYHFFCENSLWLPNHTLKISITDRIKKIHDSIGLTHVRRNNPNLPQKIFIERNTSENRCNERKVHPQKEFHLWLIKRGFAIVYLEHLRVNEQIELFSTAKVIVGVHGAGLANIIFCKKSTCVVEIQHKKGAKPFFQELANSISLTLFKIVKFPGLLDDSSEEALWHPEILYNRCPLTFDHDSLNQLEKACCSQ